MWCQYIHLPDNRLRCPNCGDETTRIWLTEPDRWPRRKCQTRDATGRQVFVMGVGDYLAQLLHALGARPKPDCGCTPMIDRMNKLGAEGCYLIRHEIVQQLKKGYKNTSYSELIAMMGKCLTTGLALKLPLGNPLLGLVDEAIRLKATEMQPQLLNPRP